MLIIACVLFALRGFLFSGMLSNDHTDMLGFWLPRFTFLGRSLRAGHIPMWNPYEMSGYRFAADPQSGWLYLPAMALFTWLSPGVAMRALIVANPLLCGLGLYALMRAEGLRRVSATACGLVASMMIASSWVAISLPFAGTLAWTPWVLLGASRFMSARSWSGRLGWLSLGALSWSQVASAHMSHGLVMCTLLTVCLLAASVWTRRGETGRLRLAAVMASIFLVMLPMASLAVLVPRLEFVKHSSLESGYLELVDDAQGVQAGEDPPVTTGIWPGWPLALAAAPGAYAGALTLLLLPLAWRGRRHRPLIVAAASAFALGYAITLPILVGAGWFQWFILKLPFGDVVLHNPGRFRYLALLCVPIVAAASLDGLIDRPPSMRQVLKTSAVGLAVWVGAPLVLGTDWRSFETVFIGLVVTFLLLRVVTKVSEGKDDQFVSRVPARWRSAETMAVVLVGWLAFEVVAGTWFSQPSPTAAGDPRPLKIHGIENLAPSRLPRPDFPEADFLAETKFSTVLSGTYSRYLTWAPPQAAYMKGYLSMQEPHDLPALVLERGTLLGARDVLGYNPVQMPGYWAYLRKANRLTVFYNATVFNLPTQRDLKVFGIRYLIVPTGAQPPVPVKGTVGRDGDYVMYEVRRWSAPASVKSTGRPLPYREFGPEDVGVGIHAERPETVIIRNIWDEGWSATVDGAPAEVRPAGLMQSVKVPKGDHTIVLRYRDESVINGLKVGAAVWLLMLLALSVTWVAEGGSRQSEEDPGRDDTDTSTPAVV